MVILISVLVWFGLVAKVVKLVCIKVVRLDDCSEVRGKKKKKKKGNKTRCLYRQVQPPLVSTAGLSFLSTTRSSRLSFGKALFLAGGPKVLGYRVTLRTPPASDCFGPDGDLVWMGVRLLAVWWGWPLKPQTVPNTKKIRDIMTRCTGARWDLARVI